MHQVRFFYHYRVASLSGNLQKQSIYGLKSKHICFEVKIYMFYMRKQLYLSAQTVGIICTDNWKYPSNSGN